VKKITVNLAEPTTLVAMVAKLGSFNKNLANTCAKFWSINIQRSMVNLLAGRKARHVIVNGHALGKASSKNRQKDMNNKLTAKERRHLAVVKELACGVCGASGPSDAHHIVQHQQYLCVPLCKDCHQGGFNGIHGQARIWKVMKKTEMSVLNETIDKLMK